jgi:beta-carotene ketolase (CrtW type)
LIGSLPSKGLLLAAAILAAWGISLVVALSLDLAHVAPALLLLALVLRSLSQTGLFIVGHDAMHGLLLPAHPGWNHRLGALALALYGALPYQPCRANHLRHHGAPGTDRDPDFCAEGSTAAAAWYVRFLQGYLSAPQMLLLLSGWGVLALLATPAHVLLFCTLPLLFSSLQLFVVGTYLPHRQLPAPGDPHQAISLDLPEWLSLLACFHFGYHWEHHAYPQLAWHQLPLSRRSRGGDCYAIGSSSWKPHWQAGQMKSRQWPEPPLPLPTTEPLMG